MLIRGILFGERLSITNLVRILGASIQVTLGEASVLGKEIRKEWSFFLQNAAFSLGDGRRLNFWKVALCGEGAVCLAYPTLFNLAYHKDAMVADVWDYSEEGGWLPIFLRSFNDWEMEVGRKGAGYQFF